MTTRRDLLALLAVSAFVPSLAGCGSGSASALVRSTATRKPGDPAAIPDVVRSLAQLGAHLMPTDANGAISPFSVGVALAMTVEGARGETRRQMLQVLGIDDTARLHDGLNSLTRHVEGLAGPLDDPVKGDRTEILLDSANQLFAERSTTFLPAFLDSLATSYGAGVETVDFKGDPEAARERINAWAAERTRDRIPEPVPPGAIDSMTRLALVNALYFKARWRVPFERTGTKAEPFTLASGAQVTAAMMHGSMHTGYAEGPGWVAARWPFVGGRLAMTFVRPERPSTWAEIGLQTVLASMRETEVVLAAPRFTIRSKLRLKGALSALGMPLAFDDARADLSGMTTEEPLHLQDVIHEGFVAIDEAGAEAAAVTVVIVGTSSGPTEIKEVTLDRPFLFAIHDVEHGTPLFLGSVGDPRTPS